MKWLRRVLSLVFQLLIMLILPFLIYIRGGIFLYEYYAWHHGIALLALSVVVFILLLIYVAMIWDAIFGANKISRASLKVKALLVVLLITAYTGYTLYNLSGSNAKTGEVKKEFTSLHPFMRMAVGTLIWLDSDLLITDLSRQQEEYKKMGLKTIKNSLHYKQETGYVHAMDLRTNGRSELRNNLLRGYFRVLGFNTLRHVGTADHLHISLSVRSKPGVI